MQPLNVATPWSDQVLVSGWFRAFYLALASLFLACGVSDLPAIVISSGSGAASGSSGLTSSGSTSSGSISSGLTSSGSTSSGASGSGSPSSGPVDAGDELPSPGDLQGKRGLDYGFNTVADLQALSQRGPQGTDGIWWWLNFTAFPDSSLSSDPATAAATAANFGIEYVPMVLNTNFSVDVLEMQIPPSSHYLLTFEGANYTGKASGANVSPQDAAAKWQMIETVAKTMNLKIVSPTVDWCTSDCLAGYSNPFTWLQDFLSSCATCQIDFIGVRTHDCTAQKLSDDLASYKSIAGNRQLWIDTMWCDPSDQPDAGTGSAEEQEAYMTQVLPMLDSDPQIFRYGWFRGRPNPGGTTTDAYDILAPEAGTLTPLGNCFTQNVCSVGSE